MFLAILLTSAFASTDVGFKAGNVRSFVTIAGNVSLTCVRSDGTSNTVNFQCRDQILLPQAYDFFYISPPVTGDMLHLIVHRPDGTVRDREVDFDSVTGRSTNRINLWANSFFQPPLFTEGENQVAYEILQANQKVTQGQFKVQVNDMGLKLCKPAHYYSNATLDCEETYTFCERYFQEQNHCQ